ncbi:ZYBA0S03-01992g1_1 [Zygosaccharomyces bailii CLIB 213]|uniref:ZYBA0S03-01992g1_1 n=1 Tax=Zygosaccharomyces bailii (strain CLIB 213 / ATCC 58445 / CBS 680 / BCRC 21525 / NBRC 1098 / NCYC 1416 / NRRL Y-2227) TaxID=1333698 RepID=A0A8J2X7Q5_ZYGB2|nr:ZYBA0S03-01992g1_1 [Zygosaccharomyces bailii CLIB 213]
MPCTIELSNEKREAQLEELKAAKCRLQKEFEELSAELSIVHKPKDVIDLHIQRLKEYNELRDVGLRLTQLIADEKACKVKDVFEEMGYEVAD